MSLWRGKVWNLRKGLGSPGRAWILCNGMCEVLDLKHKESSGKVIKNVSLEIESFSELEDFNL